MGDPYAARVALSLLLGLTALAIALAFGPNLGAFGFALLVGLVAVLTCPSPP